MRRGRDNGLCLFPSAWHLDEMMVMMSPPSGQENIFLDGEYKLQISASDGGRGRGQTAGDTLCGRAKLFSRAETQICSQNSDTNAGRTEERFNKPDWDRNYFWLPQPKRLINGIFMKGAK